MKRFKLGTTIAVVLVLGMLVGGAITQAAVTSQGGMITGCLGSGSSQASIKMASRVISPTAILLAGQPCANGDQQVNLPSYIRTVVISPNGTAPQNGTALIAAVTAINASRASATTPYLVKLEPGTYDLGTGTLNLYSYINLEGSGEGITNITSALNVNSSQPGNGTINAASNTELRRLTVTSTGTNDVQAQTAVYIPSGVTNVSLSHVTVATTGGGFSFGVGLKTTGTVSINDCTILVSSLNNARRTWGIFSANSANISVQNSTITVSAVALLDNTGIFYNGGSLNFQNSNITVSSNSPNTGIYNMGGKLELRNSFITISGNSSNTALTNFNRGGDTSLTANVYNSVLSATGGSSNQVIVFDTYTAALRNSILLDSGGTDLLGKGLEAAYSTVTIANTQVSNVYNYTSSTITCLSVYNANLAAVTC